MRGQEESDSESEDEFPLRSVELGAVHGRAGKVKSRSSNGTSVDDCPSPNSPWRSTPRSGKSPALLTLAFPISRVRRLIKSEGDIQWVGNEAGFLIAKAADLFLEKFVEDAFEKMIKENRNTLQYKDVASQVKSMEKYEFIADFIPERVSGAAVLAGKPPAD